MISVLKYPLTVTESQIIELPLMAEILHVGEQQGELFLWIMVFAGGAQAENEPVEICVTGTGNIIDPGATYLDHLGTVQMANGLVFHAFRVQR